MSKTFVIALLAIRLCISDFAQTADQPSLKLTFISNVNIFEGNPLESIDLVADLEKNFVLIMKGGNTKNTIN